jgi:hypothetical protein
MICETPYCTQQAVEEVDGEHLCEFCAIEQKHPLESPTRLDQLFMAAEQIKKEIGE